MQVILRDPEHDEHMGFFSVLLLPRIWMRWLRRGNPPLFYYNNERIKNFSFYLAKSVSCHILIFRYPSKPCWIRGFGQKFRVIFRVIFCNNRGNFALF